MTCQNYSLMEPGNLTNQKVYLCLALICMSILLANFTFKEKEVSESITISKEHFYCAKAIISDISLQNQIINVYDEFKIFSMSSYHIDKISEEIKNLMLLIDDANFIEKVK